MKNTILIIFFIVLTQITFSQGIKFGIALEPQIAWLTPDVKDVSSDGVRMGFNVGLVMDNYFAKNYAFATGISICNTGGKLLYSNPITLESTNTTNNVLSNTSVIYKLQYVTIPIGLKLKTNDIGYFRFTSNIGLTSQINIKARANSEENGISDENISKEINLFNFGYHIGAGGEYNIGGSSALIANIVYTNGFVDVTKRKEDKVNLGSLSLKIGIMF